MSVAMYSHRIRRSLEGCRPKLSLGLDLFENGYCLDLFGFLIALPFLDRWVHEPEEMMESWGFCYFDRAIHLRWGAKTKFVRMPWDFEHLKCEVLKPDGTWCEYVGCYETGQPIVNSNGVVVFEGGKEPDGRQVWVFPYRYQLKSGEVQERTATVYIERREWRQRWLWWCPLFAKKRQSISVEFDGEVGERTGSWKGGCIGCGYDMNRGETAEQTLRRMERERKF